jgi:hypothetical protein
MTVQFSNNAVSLSINTLGLSDTVLAINVADAAKFPSLGAGQWFPLTLINASSEMEIVRCTARAGNLLTIARQQEGTTARNFPIGSIVNLRVTKALLEDLRALPAGAFGLALLGATSLTDAQFLLDVPVSFATVFHLEAANVEPGTLQVEVRGYNAYGDHKPIIYKYVASEPAHNLKHKTANNLWFEIAEKDVRPEYLGGGPAAADNWYAIASCLLYLKEKNNSGSIIFAAGKTYNVTTQALYMNLMPNHVSLISDEPGKRFTLDFTGRAAWTGYNAALIDISGEIELASQQALTESMQPPISYNVISGAASGQNCQLEIGPHDITVGSRVYVYYQSSASTLSASDRAYLTMANSNEGMSPTSPIEVTAISADRIYYTSLSAIPPTAVLSEPSSMLVIKNSNMIHVASTASYMVGDLVAITTDAQFGGYTGGVITEYAELGKIVRIVDAQRMEFERGVKFSYLVSQAARVMKVNSKTVHMQDLRVISKGYNPGTGTTTDIGIRANLCDEPYYENVVTQNCGYYGIANMSCYRPLQVRTHTIADQRNRQGLATGQIEYAYGSVYGGMTFNPRYLQCSCDGARHALVESTTSDMIGMPFDVFIQDFVAKNTLYGAISTHDMIFGMEIDGALFENCATCIDSRNGAVTAKRLRIFTSKTAIILGGDPSNSVIETDYAENISGSLVYINPSATSPLVTSSIYIKILDARNIQRALSSYLPAATEINQRSIENLVLDASGVIELGKFGFVCAATDENGFYRFCTFKNVGGKTNAFAPNRISNAQFCTFENINPSITYTGTVYPLVVSKIGAATSDNNRFINVQAVLGGSAINGELSIPAGSINNYSDTVKKEFLTTDGNGLVTPKFRTTSLIAINDVPVTLKGVINVPDGAILAIKSAVSLTLTLQDSSGSGYTGDGALQTAGSANITMASSRNIALFVKNGNELVQAAAAGTA